jgi:hypothetical protein
VYQSHTDWALVPAKPAQRLNTNGIKSFIATPPDEIFYWEFCFLNRSIRENPTNATIIHSVY